MARLETPLQLMVLRGGLLIPGFLDRRSRTIDSLALSYRDVDVDLRLVGHVVCVRDSLDLVS